jgi:hypothetical protein
MTPSGAIAFAAIVIGGAMWSANIHALAMLLALCIAFGIVETGWTIRKAFAWPAAIVAPLALFMAIVWVGIVARSPAEIAAGLPGSRAAALGYVTTVCMRLFLIALLLRLIILRFAHLTPLQFIRALWAPLLLKKLLVLTLSWIDTILHAVDRSRTALVTAGVIAPRLALKNVANGWILVQTVWLSVITIAIGRARDKWPAENTLARLDEVLSVPPLPLRWRDGAWMAAAVAAVAVAALGAAAFAAKIA